MQEELQPQEKYPLPGIERWLDPKDKGKRQSKEREVQKHFNEYLKKDFYYRNITEKKKMLAEGLITED